ncbi:TetR family transcriptional regulator [Nocardia sp. NPDC005366]|uniref:TetR/AcrR family transcriptional regulator n=1 Tax=Nocardia sp. NPDC005366 TaxID=3156878 RepID=UPI0033A2DBF6
MTASTNPRTAARRGDAPGQLRRDDSGDQRGDIPKQTQRSDATRQALLRAARDEFAEYGLAGARVDRIADTAGVNKERIYGLFGSKDKLFDVILIDTMREFLDVVQPLAETEPGEYVAKLFDYHRDHPQLLRLLLWEGLHRGADAHDVDGWRAEHYVRKFDRAQEQFGVDEQYAGRLLLAFCGLANWSLAVPQTTRLLLGAAADDTDATRDFMRQFARAAMQNELIGPRRAMAGSSPACAPTVTTPAIDTVSTDQTTPAVNALTGKSGRPTPTATARSAAPEGAAADPSTAVDAAAQRLRDAQAVADAARDELGAALRAAHAGGTSANQLARQVNGTLSRPVVLRLLSDG